jgi:hypothetical protein
MKNAKTLILSAILLIGCAPNLLARPVQPDLAVRQFQFRPSSPQAVWVQVINYGGANAPPSTLRLTVRVINGIPVGRTTDLALPVIAAGDYMWVMIDATSILPVSVDLIDTTFRADADADGAIPESNETNNRLWHNL